MNEDPANLPTYLEKTISTHKQVKSSGTLVRGKGIEAVREFRSVMKADRAMKEVIPD